MSRIIKGGLLILILLSTRANSQNYYNSIYTRYNVGNILNSGFAYNKSLGGSSIGLRPHNQINYLNPASYTSQDTNSFLFHIGFTGRYAEISSELDNAKSFNSNIEYLALGLPVTKWWNFSVGAVPFSRKHYNLRETYEESTVGETVIIDYSGEGGLNEFYIGNGFEISNIVSVGVNASYLFGSLNLLQSSYLKDMQGYSAKIEQRSNYIISDFYFKTGLQVHPTFNINDKEHKIVLGVTYDLKTDINQRLKENIKRYNTNTDYKNVDSLNSQLETTQLALPSKIAIGVSYSYDDILMVTGEYIKQDWSKIDLGSASFKSDPYESIRFGVEYNPVPMKNRINVSYLKRMHYRAGGSNTKTYLNYNNKNISKYTLTAGLGFPIKTNRKGFASTMFNLSYEFGGKGTTDDGLIKENYHFINFGLVLHDFWFLKPKYD